MPGPIRYDGRVAIVTGAGAGLGKQYALFLASRGAKVLVNDVAEESAAAVVAEIAALGGEAHAAVGSVADGERIVSAAVERWGRCDILINNAGILRDMAFHKMTAQAFDCDDKYCMPQPCRAPEAQASSLARQGLGVPPLAKWAS